MFDVFQADGYDILRSSQFIQADDDVVGSFQCSSPFFKSFFDDSDVFSTILKPVGSVIRYQELVMGAGLPLYLVLCVSWMWTAQAGLFSVCMGRDCLCV